MALAIAFACRPSVVVLDEPTTGLDVTTQAHVLGTVRRMTQIEGAAALYVSHDLSVVANFADRVAVMYAGRLVEQGPTGELFRSAAHPYTRLLLAAVPRLDVARELTAIPGTLRRPALGRLAVRSHRAANCGSPRARRRCRRSSRRTRSRGRCIRRARHGGVLQRTDRAGSVQVAVQSPAIAKSAAGRLYGGHQVVHDVNLAVDHRECVALVGESGSGKTTVARSISGLHAQWRGRSCSSG